MSAGFILLPLLLIAARPSAGLFITGMCIAGIGLAIRAWASGYLKKNRELTVSGPYAHTRNPLYVGTFLVGAGVAVSTASWWFVAVFIALYLLIYVPVMMAEAETLRSLFPSQFADYQREVPLFLPRLTPYAGDTLTSSTGVLSDVADKRPRFETAIYMRHREYRATMGVLLVYALMGVKFLLIGL